MTRFTSDKPGDQPALTDERGTTSWGALNRRTNQLINALRGRGLKAGDTIAIFAGNGREYFEVLLAATQSGLLCVPVNWHFTADELAYVLADSGARLLFVEDRFADVAREALAREKTPTLGEVIQIRGSGNFAQYEVLLSEAADTEPADQCLGGPMFYTSGTTGRPKGVKSSTWAPGAPLDVLEMIGKGLSQMLNIPGDGNTLLCGPVYHSAQWAFSFLPLIAGSHVVMRHKFDAAECLDLIDTNRITNVHLVPTQFHRLLALDESAKRDFRGHSLVAVWHGAAPCPPAVKRDMIDWWGPVISEYYGSTEGSIVTTASAEEWLTRPGTVGRPSPMVEISIRDDEGQPLPSGEHGQIYVRNLSGSDFEYHNEPEKTASVHLDKGVFTFGDIGYFDEEGYLYLSDRKIDMIISGGVNIYPAEIEGVLADHPAVTDVAVFGVPNDEFGEEVKAAVVLHPDYQPTETTTETLIEHCRSHLAGYKAPRSIDYEQEMPRHETGKLYKRVLRDRYWTE